MDAKQRRLTILFPIVQWQTFWNSVEMFSEKDFSRLCIIFTLI